jgi:hypothetical protein
MNKSVISADTAIDAEIEQFKILRKLGIQARAEMTFQLSDNLCKITEAGIRYRHPDYSSQMVRLAFIRLTLGEKLFNQVYPNIRVDV